VLGWVVFVLALALLFMMFSGLNLRRRWGKGNFSGGRSDALPTFVVS
jgi:hypothetical protein